MCDGESTNSPELCSGRGWGNAPGLLSHVRTELNRWSFVQHEGNVLFFCKHGEYHVTAAVTCRDTAAGTDPGADKQRRVEQ